MTDIHSSGLPNNGPLGKIGQSPQKKEQAAEPDAPALGETLQEGAEQVQDNEHVRSQLLWLSKQGEEAVKFARMEKILKALPRKKKIEKLFEQVSDIYEEDFEAKPDEGFVNEVIANLLTGIPVVNEEAGGAEPLPQAF